VKSGIFLKMITKKHILLLAVLSAGTLYLLFANISNQYLWQDEAETALVSRTILTDGLPKGYDGKNYFSQMEGKDYGLGYVWRHHNWLPFYILAGFYKLFGISTFTSRLPFLLFGFGTVLLTYFLTASLFSNIRTAFIAFVMLSLSVSFLLLARQCRYYSLVMFFTLLSLYIYILFLERKKYTGTMLFFSSLFLFHSQNLYFIIFLVSILLHCFLFHRDRIKSLVIVMSASIAADIPWFIWLSTSLNNPYPGYFGYVTLERFLVTFCVFLKQINKYVFPVWIFLVFILISIIKKISVKKNLSEHRLLVGRVTLLFIFILNNLLFVSIIPIFNFRYICASIPLLLILTACILEAFINVHILLGIGAAVIFVISSQFTDYIYEITHDFDGPVEGIVLYLNENGKDTDTVIMTYEDLPVKFYTKMKVFGGLSGENLEPAKKADWIILRKYTNSIFEKDVLDYVHKNIDLKKYEIIEINYPDTPWQNRENPAYHLFFTRKNEDRVKIYKRIPDCNSTQK